MASGPLPKPPEQRARQNKTLPMTVVHVSKAKQPRLPGSPKDWHPQTLLWWEMWGRSPLATDFTEHEWAYLAETAVVHSRFWAGDMKQAPELRNRQAKFGVTPEDRARLRIQFAFADEAERKAENGRKAKAAPKAKFDGLQAV